MKPGLKKGIPSDEEGIPSNDRLGGLRAAALLSFLLTAPLPAGEEPPPTPGVTVFVHGFVAGGEALTTPWQYWGGAANMSALLERFGSGLVWEYDPGTGRFDNVTIARGLPRMGDSWHRASAGHQILLFDWRMVSDEVESGQAEAAADALFAALMRLEIGGEPLIGKSPYAARRPLHFVGHSRGTVVVSETVQRLARFNIRVNYVTYLDIHDFGQPGIGFDAYFHDPAVQVWDNVDYADVFYQQNPAAMCGQNPAGRGLEHLENAPFPMQRNLSSLTMLLSREECDAHDRPHAWIKDYYWGTVALDGGGNSSRPAVWYQAGGEDGSGRQHGFDLWLSGGGFDRPRHPDLLRVNAREESEAIPFVWQRDLTNDRSYFDRNDVPGVIFNGDFDLPDLDRDIAAGQAGSLAGWSSFGGGGNATVRPVVNPLPGSPIPDSYLQLTGTRLVARHNRFFLPTGATAIRFRISVPFVPVTPFFTHTLEVRIGNRVLRRFTVNETDGFEARTVSFAGHSDLLGGVNTMTFALSTRHGAAGIRTAEVHLDDIRISAIYPEPVTEVDTDGDGLSDAEEHALGTDPTRIDSDGDTLDDRREVRETKTNPLVADTDADGFTDGEEVASGTDPLDPARHPLIPFPIGYWSFDDQDLPVTADLSLAGNGGTLNGAAAYVSGHTGAESDFAITFDGVDGSVATGVGLLSELSEITMSGWVRFDSAQPARTGFFGQNDANEFGMIEPGTLSWWMPEVGALDVPFGPTRPEWTHLALVGDAQGRRVYIDGVRVAESAAPFPTVTSAFPFRIGGGGIWDVDGNWFAGEIDDVAVWNVALSEADIAALAGGDLLPIGSSTPPPPVILTEVELEPGTGALRLVWQSTPGKVYAVHRSSDLLDWTEVESSLEAEDDETAYLDPAPPSEAERLFYRVRRLD